MHTFPRLSNFCGASNSCQAILLPFQLNNRHISIPNLSIYSGIISHWSGPDVSHFCHTSSLQLQPDDSYD
ncbi:hypothetical protein ACTXT7_000832 [Hymenolepis weldensis]